MLDTVQGPILYLQTPSQLLPHLSSCCSALLAQSTQVLSSSNAQTESYPQGRLCDTLRDFGAF